MKKAIVLLVLSGFILFSNTCFAAKVSESQAKAVASTFLKSKTGSVPLSLVYSRTDAFYVFGFEAGFVIVAGDDRAFPILGYSTEGPFIVPENTYDTIKGNNFWGLMQSFEEQIQYVVDNNIAATEDIAAQWSALLAGQSSRSMTTVVPPLLTTTWDQGWPYNSLCPVDPSGPGGHVWAGCVATAMAQILKYHNYPNQGLGSYGYQWGSYPNTSANFGATTYNWSGMPNSISSVNTEVATLIYHTAVSCRSMWGPGSTGVGYTDQDPMSRAFVNYFRMAFSTIQHVSKGNYTSSAWDNLIQNELINNRPMLYRGDGIGSHAFVCDGVDVNNLYHFNFGWGGAYNGYFALSAITPGTYDFTNNQGAVIGIKPNDGSTLEVNTTWSGVTNKATHVAVPDAITLTVSAGAMVKFAQNCKLQVWGKILATGTSASYATFTAVDTTAGWWGIKFDNDYMNYEVMSDNDTSRFVYAQIQYSDMRGITIKHFSKVVIDHCKINNNFIDGDEYGYYNGIGAGIYSSYSALQLYHSQIYKNHATISGGGLNIAGNDVSLAIIAGNEIYQNISDGVGGGFFLSHIAIFSDNLVHRNQAVNGAGGALAGGVGVGEMSLSNNTFTNNATIGSTGKGGGLYLDACYAHIVNNLFVNNTANNGGALIITNGSAPLLLNNSISKNFTQNISSISLGFGSDPTFKNTIFYDNYNGNGKEFYLGNAECDPIFDHCNLQGGINALGGPGSGANYDPINYTNNIDTDPLFVSPSAGAGTGYNGLTADWSLQSLSPCINTGDTTGVSIFLPELDLAGNPRINGFIDMGAYEYGCTPVPVSVSIVADQSSVCAGTTVTFTATPTNGGTSPVYQWKKNGNNVGSNSNTYSYVPVQGDVITCVLTSNLSCVTGNPATSNAITMTVTTPLAVSVSIVANNNPICAGSSVTFIATPVNGGTTPSYQWKVNGVNAGTNNSSYTYVPLNGDIVTCVLTSSLTCTTNNPATSNVITMTVNALPLANAGTDQSINYGLSTTLNGSATGGSGSYTWHWEPVNLLLDPDVQNPGTVNHTASTLFILTATDAVSGCAGSDQVLVSVSGGALALIVMASPDEICVGNSTQLNAIVSGGSGTYTYSWTSNPAGFTSDIPNPIVFPAITTTYTVTVNDGSNNVTDNAEVTVNPFPGVPAMPAGPAEIDLYYVTSSEYSTSPAANADYYIWTLEPATMGTIAGNGTSVLITWSGSLGQASLNVTAVNACGEGVSSGALNIQVDNTVGVALIQATEVSVNPNPCDGMITVAGIGNFDKIELFGSLGSSLKTIYTNGQNELLLNLSGIRPGVYYLRMSGESRVIVKKVLKR